MSMVTWVLPWYLLASFNGCFSHYYDDSSWNHHHHQAERQTPQELMVDLINDLGLKLLAIHNEDNENNIALSPYGALSVLVALGEGVRGTAVSEIQHAVHIPDDISIVRVGLRDIHRHLKSYFIPEEGFLGGLTFNNDNVTLNPEYKEVLRFYGYDVDSFNNALYPEPGTTTTIKVDRDETVATTDSMEVTSTLEPSTTNIMTASTETPTTIISTTTAEIPTSTQKMMETTLELRTTRSSEEKSTTSATTSVDSTTIRTTRSLSEEVTSTISDGTTPVTSTTDTRTTRSVEEETTTSGTSSSVLSTMLTTKPPAEQGTTESFKEESTTKAASTSELSTIITTSTSEEQSTIGTSAEELSTIINTQSAKSSEAGITTEAISPNTSLKEESTSTLTTEAISTVNIRTASTLEDESTTILSTEAISTVDSRTSKSSEPEVVTSEPTTLELSTTMITEPLISTSETQSANLITEAPPVTMTTDYDDGSFEDSALTTTRIGLMMENFDSNEGSLDLENFDNSMEQSTPNAEYFNENTAYNDDSSENGLLQTTTSNSVATSTIFNPDESMATEFSSENYPFYPDEGDSTTPEALAFTSEEELLKNKENNEIDTRQGVFQNQTQFKRKRKTRSVVDYIIARYYDRQQKYNHFPQTQPAYKPEEQLSFLTYNKYREQKINFMKYDTVLPFNYIPHLDALALSFPLDSSKYYLLLLLPVNETGIDKLICDLRLNGNLKYIIQSLRYTHIVATIPSFTLKGYVVLTPTLQKLGIRKVFEPRQADFSPMTDQKEIYVKNIEQAVTVKIRNYVDPTTIEPYRNLHQFQPVQFKADHAFLYFVMDSELHITLMAGKIVNPLNSRIR